MALKVAVVGAGWAGMAAAVSATRAGHCVTVFEASRTLGGRARAVKVRMPDGSDAVLDNGQHILIGAYSQTLALMAWVGVDANSVLLRMPLALQFPNGKGLVMPDWPSPLNALAGILRHSDWSWTEKITLLLRSGRWQRQGFQCPSGASVEQLCAGLPQRLMDTLIEPLCVSALNTPPARASGQVFLRVLQDSLFGARGSSDLLLPRTDLSRLLPQACADWLQTHGGEIQRGRRVDALEQAAPNQWRIHGVLFDAVVLACPSTAASHLAAQSGFTQWAASAQNLQFESIATVYAHASGLRLPLPMLVLPSQADQPAQFVFDRGQLGGPAGLMAFVVSANTEDREQVEAKVLQQAAQLFPGAPQLLAVKTVVEKRATFSCTPGLVRPQARITQGLWACGDYVAGPYPATLEGAIRSGMEAGQNVGCST